MWKCAFILLLCLTVCGALTLGQDDPNAPLPDQPAVSQDPAPDPQQPINQPLSNSPGWHRFNENRPPDPLPSPPQLQLASGSWLAVRVDQPISSDHNQPGDAFMATLVQPVLVNGVVVARKGQSVMGRVSVAEKAGRVKGTSRLGLELTQLVAVDGQQLPIRTQLVTRNGNTSIGRDVGAVGITTGTGAAIGAAAAGGIGAALGAAAGAGASLIGVLVTRGEPTVITPETLLTFQTQAPVLISTAQAPDAFRPVTPQDYNSPAPRYRAGPPSAPAPRPPHYAPYPYYPYPYPAVYFRTGYWGPRYYYRRW